MIRNIAILLIYVVNVFNIDLNFNHINLRAYLVITNEIPTHQYFITDTIF